MGLGEYHRKRDFDKTAEPRGSEHPSGPTLSYVIQKHAATNLHYDFRLELDGVLKSWAVPKGPSLDPSVKRLAVHVEDHPIEYGSFEGVIPKGEYGGGTVMLWDNGSWEPREDPHKGYRKGSLKFYLHGEKLRGGWHLVRSRRPDEGDKEQWLLFKDDDGEARPESEGTILDEKPNSVATGRSLAEIAAQADATWHSNRPARDEAKQRFAAAAAKAKEKAPPSPTPKLDGARKASLPKELQPELATLVDDVPPGDDWLHEIKFDGYRLLVFIDGEQVRMVTRKGNDWSDRFSSLCDSFRALPVKQALLDGEVVIVAPDGTTSFQALQNVMNSARQEELVFYGFDLLHLDGYDIRAVPLLERKEALRAILEGAPERVRFSDHVVGNGRAFHRQACGMGLEGIITKRCSSPYLPKRTKDWLKIKCQRRQEFVIGGWTDPKGSRKGFGSLILGVYRDGELVHTGRVGTGFDEARLADIGRRLKKLALDRSPFVNYGHRRPPRDIHWVKPELVAEVGFAEWTDEGVIRHPTFQGLREDKDPREVVREDAQSLPRVAKPSPAPDTGASAKADSSELARPVRSRDGMEHPPSTRSRPPGRKTNETEVAGVRLSNPSKVLYPDVGVTKLDLARYYEAIGEEWMLPYIGDRPLTLVRCPEGADKPCFYQKKADEGFPQPVGRVRVGEDEDDVYTYVDSVPGLVSMVQMGVLELHVWGAKRDNLDRPDLFVIDLDPAPDVAWERVVATALLARQELGALGLESWCKTTGGKGLHVVVPIARRNGWDEVKEFSRLFCQMLSRLVPGQYITKATLDKRKGKIFLDYLRNGRGATAISAYSVRSRSICPVSVPVAWSEVTPRLDPQQFTPETVVRRLAKLKKDPWEGFYTARQALTKAAREAVGMK